MEKTILDLFSKSKAIKRYVRSHIARTVPHSSVLKIFYRLITVLILKPECVEVNQLDPLVGNVQRCIVLLMMSICSTQEPQSIKRNLKY